MTPDLSIIIVSWNVRDLLRACLASLRAGRGALALEIIVVDGASHDGSAAMVAAEFPEVRLLAQTENVGFPRGNNIGLAAATGRYLLLLNPDTEVVGDALTILVDYLEAHPAVGLVGPQLRFGDGSVQSSRRRFPTLATGFFESTWLEPWAPARVLDDYYVRDRPDDALSQVDWLMGACLLLRRAVYEQVGGMDEGYFMYSEELDWCRRIKDAGWQLVYQPEAVVIHYQGKSSEQVVANKHIYFQRAKLRYFRKFHGAGPAALLRLFLLVNYAGQLKLEAVKWLLGHKRDLRRERMAAYWAVLRSGLPPAG